jgi:hypothetical protein
MERMDGNRQTENVYTQTMEGIRPRNRSRHRWRDIMDKYFKESGITNERVREREREDKRERKDQRERRPEREKTREREDQRERERRPERERKKTRERED